ncbi:MAG: glycosyltransferase [Bacteroidota bacterium]|nr:glycosyltransferase [Bacteroidota bacterium]
MISIIICHRNIELLNAIKKSIKTTVGVPYELIIIDNTNNHHSIFSAYNEGVKKANYNIVCFAHEDILFYTDNWGEKVLKHFEDPQVGMIGVLGGMAQSVIPSAWWFNNYFAKSARNYLMRNAEKKDGKLYHYCSNPFRDTDKSEVVIIDGLWFCIRKSLFDHISFNEKTFSGFHLYDADISMQVLQHKKNYVVHDILIEHIWCGSISEDFYNDLIIFTSKWKSYLPVLTGKVESKYMDYYNWHALRSLILEMKTKSFSRKAIRDILKMCYPVAKEKLNSKWFRSYFFLSRFIGYANANRIFYRAEKLSGFCKVPDYTREEYKTVPSF